MIEIRELSGSETRHHLRDLAGVLLDCVRGGASVNFMTSMTLADAEAFYTGVLAGVERGDRILLAAFLDAELVGTVQVVFAPAPNQPHRADVAKLLVHRSARGQGIARRLMHRVEEVSHAAGRTLLVLDTVTGDAAEQLYLKLGWHKLGVIPNYALYPDGRWCDTTVFWKQLAPSTLGS